MASTLDTLSVRAMVEALIAGERDPGVLAGLARLFSEGVQPAEIGFFSHGTTVTTNSVLQLQGARIGLLITAGYRAVQEVQRG